MSIRNNAKLHLEFKRHEFLNRIKGSKWEDEFEKTEIIQLKSNNFPSFYKILPEIFSFFPVQFQLFTPFQLSKTLELSDMVKKTPRIQGDNNLLLASMLLTLSLLMDESDHIFSEMLYDNSVEERKLEYYNSLIELEEICKKSFVS